MNQLAVFLPTYKRPDSLQKIVDNLKANTKSSYTLYFGMEKDDIEGLKAAMSTDATVLINKYSPGYSNTIQTLYESSKEPFFIHANDDFEFLPEWDLIPLSMFERQDLMVVGLKQQENDNGGSAISMVRRKYIEEQSGVIDMPNRVFFPYPHHYVDTEFTYTARKRGVWAICDKWVINHRHYGFENDTKPDETNRKNDATSEQARQIFETRQHLWS